MKFISSVVLVSFLSAICTAQTSTDPAWIAEVHSANAKVAGALSLEGNRLRMGSGSSVSSAERATILTLARGGSLLVCPATKTSLSGAKEQLMIAMNTGALELNYENSLANDTVITPDFRIAIDSHGPGGVAVNVNAQGDTCVKSIASQQTAMTIYELLGSHSYRMQAGEQLLFRNGQIASATRENVSSCGCPAVEIESQVWSLFPHPAPTSAKNFSRPTQNPNDSDKDKNVEQPLPPPASGAVQVQIDAPFVFNAAANEVPVPTTVVRVHLATVRFPAMLAFWKSLEPSPATLADYRSELVAPSGTTRRGQRSLLQRIKGLLVRLFK